MPFLLISLILWLGAIGGWGGFGTRILFGRRSQAHFPADLGRILLLGFYFLGNLALMINFFYPLRNEVSVLSLFIGWMFLFLFNRDRFRSWRLPNIAFGVVCLLGLSVLAVVSYFNIDTGYYHLPSISLIQRFPLLPGVANLFGPFGHNSIWFGLEALFRLPRLGLSSVFAANSLLAFACLLTLKDFFIKGSFLSLGTIASFLLMFNHVGLGLGGVTPDFAVTVLSLLCWLCFLELLSHSEKDFLISFPFLMTLTCFAILVKISAINLIIPLCVVFLFKGREINSLQWVRAFCVNGVFLFFWLCRGLLTSGCGLYPQKATCFPSLKWAMPVEKVGFWFADIKKHLCGVAIEGSVFSSPQCLEEWWKRLWSEPIWKSVVVLMILMIVLKISQCLLRKKNQKSELSRSTIFVASLSLVAILAVWLAAAPNLRFLLWWVFAVMGIPLSITLESILPANPRPLKIFYLGLLLAWAMTFRSAWLTRPYKVQWIEWPMLPERQSELLISEQGLSVSKPLNDFRCWDMAPPCTPEDIQFKVHRGILNRVWFSPKSD